MPTWAISAAADLLAWSARPPGLLLNYFGQGALIIAKFRPSSSRVFFELVPHGLHRGRWSILATVATVIASQAVISGVFSVTTPGGPSLGIAAAADGCEHSSAVG